MKAETLWQAVYSEFRQHGYNEPIRDPLDRVEFDFFGLDAAEYWAGGNMWCFDIRVGDTLVSLYRCGSHQPCWRFTQPPDSALVDLALRVDLENNFTN